MKVHFPPGCIASLARGSAQAGTRAATIACVVISRWAAQGIRTTGYELVRRPGAQHAGSRRVTKGPRQASMVGGPSYCPASAGPWPACSLRHSVELRRALWCEPRRRRGSCSLLGRQCLRPRRSTPGRPRCRRSTPRHGDLRRLRCATATHVQTWAGMSTTSRPTGSRSKGDRSSSRPTPSESTFRSSCPTITASRRGTAYVMASANNLPLQNGASVTRISWELVDDSLKALDSTALLAAPPISTSGNPNSV